MSQRNVGQLTNQKVTQDYHLGTWIEAFLFERKAQNLSKKSVEFYRDTLTEFQRYADSRAVTGVLQLNPQDIRYWLVVLEERGHNPGGIHAYYRGLRAFLNWFETEAEPDGWKNPLDKVKPPKVPEKVLEPASDEIIQAVVRACERGTFLGDRDRAVILFLLDSGVRASELTALDLENVDPVTGAVVVRQGKGRKSRTVFIGKRTRKELRNYLRTRGSDDCPAVFVTEARDRLRYEGLRKIIDRRSAQARVKSPGIHAFRRAFALTMLRNGTNVFTLQKLMGHADLAVLKRYLKLVTDDLAQAHRENGPVDRLPR